MTPAVASISRKQDARAAVLAYKHPVLVARLEEKLKIAHTEATQLFEDMKMFLYLCGISPESISPSETIDFTWHEFILFTQDYAHFCESHFGHFIHHRPRHPEDLPTKREGSQRAVALAREIFGNDLSENWTYPISSDASEDPCDNCGCNAAL